MGSFIDEKSIINNNIQNYNNYVNDKGKFIEGSPTFVTYYNKNNDASSEDIGLGNVVEIIGSESPIKFNRISDFPLYNFDEIQLEYEFDDEMGLSNSIEGTAIIIPGTIKPLPDDYFTVSYLNRKYLFKVNNVSGSSIGSKFFYKIDYSISNSNVDMLEERQVEERYDVIYDNLGTKQKSLISESLNKYVEKLDTEIEKLKKAYVKNYYNKNMNLFILYDEFFDNYLHEFINNNNLFIRHKTFLQNIMVEPPLYVDRFYINSIYELIENGSLENLNDVFNSVRYIPISKQSFNIFSHQYREYKQTLLINENSGVFSEVINGLSLGESNKWYIEILIAYFKEFDHLEDKVVKILSLVNNRISNNEEMYFIVPCIIYILINLKNIILNK